MACDSGLAGGHRVLGFCSVLGPLWEAIVGFQAEEKWALTSVSEGPHRLLGGEQIVGAGPGETCAEALAGIQRVRHGQTPDLS